MNIEELLRASGRTSKTVMQVEKVSKTSKVIFIVSEAIVRELSSSLKITIMLLYCLIHLVELIGIL